MRVPWSVRGVALTFLCITSFHSSMAMSVDDARQVLSGLVAAYGPVPVTTQEGIMVACPQRTEHGMRYDSCPKTINNTVNKILSFGPVQLTLAAYPQFGDPVFQSSPDQLYIRTIIRTIIAQNCTNLTLPPNATTDKTLSLLMSNTSSTTITHTVSNTVGASFSVKYATKLYGEYEGGVSYSETVSTQTAQSNGVTTEWSDNTTVHVPPPAPMSALAGEFHVYQLKSEVPFSETAVLDAPLEANDRGLRTVADIASADKRTVTITGVISLAGASITYSDYASVPFDITQCLHQPSDKPVTYSGAANPAARLQVKALVDSLKR